MSSFTRLEEGLACEGVPLAHLAAAEGTPLYVYSTAEITSRYREVDKAFAAHPHEIHYALKANSTLAIARLVRSLGGGADANSGGEIDVALRAGFIPTQIVFTGVGKTVPELEQAIDLGVRTINAESRGELERIDAASRARQSRTRVALRVNPDIDARTHPHISTGLSANKFGIAVTDVREIGRWAAAQPGLELVGLHSHVGSQITDLAPLSRAAGVLAELARELRDDGVAIEHLDLGGGLGISYDGTPAPSADDYAAALLPAVRDSGLAVVLEPGRSLVGPAGILLASVVDVKDRPGGRTFVILDTGMTELLRPMLYGAYHRIEPVHDGEGPEVTVDVVGPLCETSDTLGTDRRMPRPRAGDLIAIRDAGAYSAVMASNYNRRTMPAEVLVDGHTYTVIRRRQSIDDLLALES